MSSQLLGISVSGLRAAQTNLNVTGNNISNAGVEGYSRQIVSTEAKPSTLSGPGYVGTGVNIDTIDRVVNEFVTRQLHTDTSLNAELSTYGDNIQQLDRLLAEASTGLSTGLESFYAALQNGADDPTSIPARQLIISEADNLADRFNTLYDRLTVIEEGVRESSQAAVEQINALSENVARLNQKIAEASGKGNGAAPNDLLDQRDEAIRQLSKLVGIQTFDQGFGQVNIVLNNGQNLVVGNEARELNLVPSEANAKKNDLVLRNGADNIVVTQTITGGELGGLLRFQDSRLEPTYNELGRIALVTADSFNEAHRRGIDLNNSFGEDFFFDVNGGEIARERVISNAANASPQDRVAALEVIDASHLTSDDYELRIESGGRLSVRNLNSGEEVATGALSGALPQRIEFDGLALVLESGSFQAGDVFRLEPFRSGARDFSSQIFDPASIAFASPLLTGASLGNIGNAKIDAGEVLTLVDNDGNPLPLFANEGEMQPPLLVRFTSPNTYDILDNSNPGNPVDLDPPIRNQRYVAGVTNQLFSDDPGERLVQSNGDVVGLPAGRTPLVGAGTVGNGYPAEAITFTLPGAEAGASSQTINVFTDANASARETASLLSNVPGVNARASNAMEITDVQSLTRTEPLQITLNGASLIAYEFDVVLGSNVIAAEVPDPATDPDAFNDYLAAQINSNENLAALGIYAVAGSDPNSGIAELRVYSTEGDDFQIALEADAIGANSLDVSDGRNPAVTLSGNGAGVPSSIAIGGQLDVRLSDGVSMGAFPSDSLLFGDTQASDFARASYLGIQASIEGVPQTGDIFTLEFNRDAASDNRNALGLSELQDRPLIGGETESISDSYGSLVEKIGIDTASTRINRDASEQVLEETTRLRDSASAVNLDEEAANLIKFEQMYSANAQVISVARDLFDRLISAF